MSPCPGIERVTSLRILGVIVNDRMTAADHVTMLLSSCSSLLYAMIVLRAHGIPSTSLHEIFRATVVSRVQYAAPAWSGMCSSADRAHLDSILRRSKRLGYSSNDLPSIVSLMMVMMIYGKIAAVLQEWPVVTVWLSFQLLFKRFVVY